jgi:hypothetical protein
MLWTNRSRPQVVSDSNSIGFRLGGDKRLQRGRCIVFLLFLGEPSKRRDRVAPATCMACVSILFSTPAILPTHRRAVD